MKHYFFDLDGTLADTDRDIRESWKAALNDLQLECPDFDAKFIAGPPLNEMVKLLFPTNTDPTLAEKIRTGFARHYDSDGFPNTREYPGVLDAVRAIKSRGIGVHIVTNKRYLGAQAMARHFGWDRVFDGVYAGDMYRETPIGCLRKPELLALVMKKLDASASECTLIGDTINDFEAAKKNNVRVLGVAWGYGKPNELAEADCVISRPAELLG